MIVLASASPRRRELLTQAGFSFLVAAAGIDASGIDEARRPGEPPIALALRLAREKAEDVAGRLPADENEATIVIGADTVVVCADEALGKPADAADAKRMLRLLAGRTHQVVTGVCVIGVGGSGGPVVETAAEVTFVTVNTIADSEIDAYVAGGEPMDKAGAYAIQGYAARWIPRIQGCYFNVVGLPVALVGAMIEGVMRRTTRPDELAR